MATQPKPQNEAPRTYVRGIFSFFGVRNPPKQQPSFAKASEGNPRSSASSLTRPPAKADKNTSRLKRISAGTAMLLLLVGALLAALPQQNLYAFRAESEQLPLQERAHFVLPTPAPYPERIVADIEPAVNAHAAFAIDTQSGVILYQKNADDRLLPASTTKIMTALIALQEYKLSDVVTVKTVITEGQVMGLLNGETITVENLLYGALVHSANDAAYALAEHHPGGVSGFIQKMNERAQELHLKNTAFANPIGFDDPNQYTSAQDLARLSLTALNDPTFTKIVSLTQITVSDTTFSHFHPLKNINELLGKIPGVSGIKTGWTEQAGQALVATVQRDGHKVLTVVLKSEDRFLDTENLLNWIFASFTWKTIQPS